MNSSGDTLTWTLIILLPERNDMSTSRFDPYSGRRYNQPAKLFQLLPSQRRSVNKRAMAISLLSVGIVVGQTKPTNPPPPKPETRHLRFVQEFVHELIEDESRKANGEKELIEVKTPDEQFSTGIYFSKSTQLELRSQIAMLKSMRLKEPFDTLIPSLIGSYQQQIDWQQKSTDMLCNLTADPT